MNRVTAKSICLLAPAMLLLLAFFLLPSFDVIRASAFDPHFTMRHFERLFGTSVYMDVFFHTLQVSLVVAISGAVIGYPVAYFLSQQPRHLQFRLILFIFIPLWMSILIRSFSWMMILGREGVVNSVLVGTGITDASVGMLYTTGAVYIGMLQILLPVQIVASYSAMTEIDMDVMRAARVSGANSWQSLRRIFLPLSLDGTVTGVIIVFMLSMGFFITPALLGGRTDLMLANLIMQQIQNLNWGFAAALALFLLVATIAMVVVMRYLGRVLARILV